MKSFSERMGITPTRVEIQRESIDDETKNALWNIAYLLYFDKLSFHISDNNDPSRVLLNRLWMGYFHRRYDDFPSAPLICEMVKEVFIKSPWYEVFNVLEFILNNYELDQYHGGVNNPNNKHFVENCNKTLERFLSAYRFIDFQISEISSSIEIESIEEALNNPSKPSVKIHLKRALELFSDRTNPDYRNSIKESISAVEAYCKLITGEEKTTLGKALAFIEKNHALHGSLKTAFNALYGYSSDAEGIRHALLEQSDLNQEDAKFILVTCSAFINYLTVKTG
ncbi:MAG: hypothetical protein WC615_04900 [Mucilaginibacter sp.]|jgi:hypothetical protein|uniref:AbiJ-NTD4 domain-containing protein n=1 Tax=Mucilaginibacter sp. TaxID=1882438 RepID=UPI003568FC22